MDRLRASGGRCFWPAALGVVLVVGMGTRGWAGDRPAVDYALLDRVLETYVDSTGRVDYAGLKAHPGDLNRFTGALARVSPESDPGLFPTREERLAYWINAYNALVLQGVLAAYPLESVLNVAGFFQSKAYPVGEEEMTLDHIEHEILRKRFREPRIHAAINCASAGCPRMRPKAYRPENLDAELEEAMRGFVRNPQHVRLDREAGILYLSGIFKWFTGDFTGWYERTHDVENASIVDYVREYLPDAEREFLMNQEAQVEFLEYDWALNDQRKP